MAFFLTDKPPREFIGRWQKHDGPNEMLRDIMENQESTFCNGLICINIDFVLVDLSQLIPG
jgi:hypothetical protein